MPVIGADLRRATTELDEPVGSHLGRWAIVLLALVALTACGGEADVRVLFIGNSLTRGHDVPSLVEEIAADNGVRVDAEMFAPGGAFLSDHLANADVVAALRSGEFDVVVLQEQSMAPAHPETFRTSTQPSAQSLVDMARAGGARVVWFQTWGHLNGNEITGHSGYPDMQGDIEDAYDELSFATGASVARVGTAFEEFLATGNGVPLHHSDGVHSSPAGAYLAALTLTPHITGAPVTQVDGVGTVDDATAELLLAAA